MCSILSRFLAKITRTRRLEGAEGKLDLLTTYGRFSVLSSVQNLLGACCSSGVFIVVGIAVKQIAGPSMILAVILGALFASFNSLPLCELIKRFPTCSSYYTIIYNNLGEVFAFLIAWFRLIQSAFTVSLVSAALGEHVHYLTNTTLGNSWLGLSPREMWVEIELDTLLYAVAFLALVTVIASVGLPLCSSYNLSLFWINSGAFVFMFVLLLVFAQSFHWIILESFEPFKLIGTLQGMALSTFFFTNLDKIVECPPSFKNTNFVVPVSLCVSLLSVLVYYLCATVFIASSMPTRSIPSEATIPKIFASITFHESKYVLCAVAFLVFILTVMQAYVNAQISWNLLIDDGLIHQRLSIMKKRTSVFSALFITLFSIPLFIFLPVANLIEGFCIVSLIITIIINSTTIIVQYQPMETSEYNKSVFPTCDSTKNLIMRLLLCCGCLVHKKVLSKLGVTRELEPTEQTSKLVNWSVIFFIPSCFGLGLALVYGLPVFGENKWVVLGTTIFFIITILFNFCVITMQPRGEYVCFQSSIIVSFVPLLNIGLSCVLMVTLNWIGFVAVGIFTLIGFLFYCLFGFTHSNIALSNRKKNFLENPGHVRYDSPPQLDTHLRQVQPDMDSQQSLYSDDEEMSDFPPPK